MASRQSRLTRRILLVRGSAGALSFSTAAGAAQQARPKKEPLKPELVREFVLVAHKDLDRVRELLEQEPALLNAAWDWGGGDWETAMGAAGHTGQKEIARFLLERGARMDLFPAAMLGKLEMVKATLAAFPELLHSRGPHGIPLMTHAKMGGEDAQPVAEYLKSLGVKDKDGA